MARQELPGGGWRRSGGVVPFPSKPSNNNQKQRVAVIWRMAGEVRLEGRAGALKFGADWPIEKGNAMRAQAVVRGTNRGRRIMAIAGIAASSLFQALNFSAQQTKAQKFQSEFQQLGQDLQSGNLSQAQSDFAALQSAFGSSSGTSSASATATTGATSTQTSGKGLFSELAQLGNDLQSGNLTAAQQDYATAQQDLQQAGASSGHHHHHHGGGGAQNSATQSAVSQLFAELGSALQSGSLSNAQTAYASLQQEFTQLESGGNGTTSSSGTGSTVSAFA